MNVKDVVKTIFLTEILKGLALTLRSFFSRPVTRQYPEEERAAMPGFRGMHALVRESSTGREKCIACGLCAAVCPSQCITIHTAEADDRRKVAERYEIDALRCLFCSLCVEACPVGAVVLTEHYEYSNYSRSDFLFDKERLLSNWDTHMAGEKGKTYLRRFWLPRSDAFAAYEGQPVGRAVRREAP